MKTEPKGEHGAYLIELAIALPIFLGLLLALIDIARITTGYASVRSAALLGARRGAAYARPEWEAVKTLYGNNQTVDSTTFKSFVNADGVPEFRSADQNADWYSCMMLSPSNPPCDTSTRTPITRLFRIEARAIAYANQVMRRNVSAIKYPCNAQFDSLPHRGSPGCFRCFTLRGDSRYDQFFKSGFPGSGLAWTGHKMLAVSCEYDTPIVATSIAFGWLPRFVTVSSTSFVSIDFYDDGLFHPGGG